MSAVIFVILAGIGGLLIYNGANVHADAETIFQQIYALTSAGFGFVLIGIGIAITYLGGIVGQARRTADVMERMEDVWRGAESQSPAAARRAQARDFD